MDWSALEIADSLVGGGSATGLAAQDRSVLIAQRLRVQGVQEVLCTFANLPSMSLCVHRMCFRPDGLCAHSHGARCDPCMFLCVPPLHLFSWLAKDPIRVSSINHALRG